MVREPVAEPPPRGEQWHHKNWHRDGGRHVLTDPLLLWKAQAIFFLGDVDDSTHCFSIAPESVEEKRALAAEPDEDYGETVARTWEPAQPLGESRGVDLHGKAGSAVIVNSASVHAGCVRQTPSERRTLHIYYSRATQPCVSVHTRVPRRLVESVDPVLWQLFGRKPNKTTLDTLGARALSAEALERFAADYERDGCAIARGVFDAQQLGAIRAEAERLVAEVAPTLPPGEVFYDGQDQVKEQFRLESHLARLEALRRHPSLLALARALLGELKTAAELAAEQSLNESAPEGGPATDSAEERLVGVGLFDKPPGGAAVPPHQDNCFQNWVGAGGGPCHAATLTLALDESSLALGNAPLTIARGSHRLGDLAHGPSGVPGFSRTLVSPLDGAEHIALELQPGDVCVHSMQAVHSSDPNSGSHRRRQLALGVVGKQAMRDEAKWAAYLADLREKL
jgi:ectoine hydroxylase-related dioxygenase (phytanoyl-CoA dioxygenase family)